MKTHCFNFWALIPLAPRRHQGIHECSFFFQEFKSSITRPSRVNDDNGALVWKCIAEQVDPGNHHSKPSLHPVEHCALCQTSHCRRCPWFLGTQPPSLISILIIQKKLSAPKEPRFVNRVSSTLIACVKGGEPIDLVTKKINSHRSRCRRSEDVDNATSDCELTTMFDLGLSAIALSDK